MTDKWHKKAVDYSLLGGAFSLAFLYSLRRMADSDLWLHLKCGEYFYSTGRILRTHLYNCSWPDFPYLNHEWLFQAVIYGLYHSFGEAGLVALQVLLVLLSFFILYRILRLYTDNLALISFILSLGIMASSHRYLLRPNHFSYVFLLYFLFSLHQYQRGVRRYAYALPPLMVVWVNMHAESLWGIMVPAVFIAAEYLKTRRGTGMSGKDLGRLAAIFCAVVVASMINPFGYKTVIWPLLVMKEQFAGVEELLSPVTLKYFFFWLYCVLFVVAVSVGLRRSDPVWLILSGIFAVIAWTANRGIPHFVFVSAPLVAASLERVISGPLIQARASSTSVQRVFSVFPMFLRAVLAIFLLYGITSVLGSPRFLQKYDGISYYPEGAVEFMKAQKISGNVFNEHAWGGYIVWNAYPGLRPYIDGRFFYRKFFKEYEAILAVYPGWQDVLSGYGITSVLLPYSKTSGGTLNDRLFSSLHWRLVYWDDVSLLYLKDTGDNAGKALELGQNIINPDRQLYGSWETDPELARRANEVAERNLSHAPGSYKALLMSANTLFSLGEYRTALKRYEGAMNVMEERNAWVYLRIALCYRHLGELNSARIYAQKCLSLAPDSPDARQLLRELNLLQPAPGGY